MPDPRRLFLHCVHGLRSQASPDLLAGSPWYPERALVMARAGDLVGVPAAVDPDHLDLLNGLGIGPAPEGVIVLECDGDGECGGSPRLSTRLLRDERALARIAGALHAGETLELHPYAVTPEIHAVADALEAAGAGRVRVLGGDPAAVRVADQKHLVRAKAVELGIPVAPGEVVELPFAGGRRRGDFEPVRAAIQRQLRWTGQVLVRGTEGAAGSSTFIVGRGGDDTEGVIRQLAARSDNRIYLVEALVDLSVSPNLHARVEGDGTVACLSASDQRWGRPLAHAGNVFPSAGRTLHDMEAWVRSLGGWLAAQGYAGDVGFDFVEYRDPATGATRSFLAEVNPRVNGANYPLALRAGLNRVRRAAGERTIAAFASGVLTTGAERFAELRETLGDLLYTHERGAGVLPYGIGCLAAGRCPAAALAGSRQDALELLADAQAAMEAACAGR